MSLTSLREENKYNKWHSHHTEKLNKKEKDIRIYVKDNEHLATIPLNSRFSLRFTDTTHTQSVGKAYLNGTHCRCHTASTATLETSGHIKHKPNDNKQTGSGRKGLNTVSVAFQFTYGLRDS